ncbi:MAG: HAD hydrolase-like protein [Clostridia bacterium]|nr:HAD hydrolase-like protein [Clostridia bacterium]
MYKNYLFDLDGTLTDSAQGIKNSIIYSLKKADLPVLPECILDKFIGPPLHESYAKYCNLDEEDADLLVKYYREYFSVKGLFENSVYDGIPETLDELRSKGKHLYVATSKPEVYAKRILEHFGLIDKFEFVGGSTMSHERTDKAEVIDYVITEMNLDKSKTVMVGDRSYDVEGAHKNGIKAIAVLFGFGDREELSDADYIAPTPHDISLI